MNGLVSIIVPIYKVERYIKKCVHSIICQTYKNIEIILVDDGSPDNCPAICDEFAKTDDRIKVIHKENGGLSSARNAGLDVANGEYICFIDSDDYVESMYIEKMYNRITKDKSDIAICEYYRVDECGNLLPHKIFEKNLIIDTDLFWKYLCTTYNVYFVVSWNKLYKSNLWSCTRFKEGKINEDVFVVKDIISKCNRISTLTDQLYYYCIRNGSIMQSFSEKHLDNDEAYIELIQYLLEIKKRKYAKEILLKCTLHLDRSYLSLSQSDRYLKIRNKYKNVYKKVYPFPEISKSYFHCTMYFFSDKLYSIYRKFAAFFKDKNKILTSK